MPGREVPSLLSCVFIPLTDIRITESSKPQRISPKPPFFLRKPFSPIFMPEPLFPEPHPPKPVAEISPISREILRGCGMRGFPRNLNLNLNLNPTLGDSDQFRPIPTKKISRNTPNVLDCGGLSRHSRRTTADPPPLSELAGYIRRRETAPGTTAQKMIVDRSGFRCYFVGHEIIGRFAAVRSRSRC